MSMVTDAVASAYCTARLQFIRVDRDNQRFKVFLKKLLDEPAVHALTSTAILRPQGSSEINYLLGAFADALLGVAICLLPSKDNDDAQEPVIIGEMTVGEGGIPGAISHNRTASIGISLLTAYQGQGYGREAVDWALDWSFRHAGLHTVSISTSSFNTRAASLYEKMGFVPEGRRRQCVWFNRKWYDDLLFSMTEDEWEALRSKTGV